jgi:predicted RNA-binding protein associated with RNAse of E/G family
VRRFGRGETILLREVHEGRIWTARPGIVVDDRPNLLAVHIPVGTLWKVPAADRADMLVRRKNGWTLTDHEWRRGQMLWLMSPGVAHAVHLWWHGPDWQFGGWYVNLQDPIRRTQLGVDFLDQHLDVVIDPDFSWRWKDEDELADAVEIGLLSRQQADAIRAEGERAIHCMQAGASPFREGWEEWRPDPSWPIPTLPDGWEIVQPAPRPIGRGSRHSLPGEPMRERD